VVKLAIVFLVAPSVGESKLPHWEKSASTREEVEAGVAWTRTIVPPSSSVLPKLYKDKVTAVIVASSGIEDVSKDKKFL